MKHKKTFVLMFCLLYLLCQIQSASDAVLYLKAYKYMLPKSGMTNLYVVDSITSDPNHYDVNLGYLGDGVRNFIDVTSELDTLLGDRGQSSGAPVFAFRVESNESGNYEITIDFKSPFENETDSSQVVDFSATLENLAAQPANEFVKFNQSEWQATGTQTVNSDDPNRILSASWTADNNSGKEWAVRGSVSMVIDSDDYKATTGYGEYSTNVVVTLTNGG